MRVQECRDDLKVMGDRRNDPTVQTHAPESSEDKPASARGPRVPLVLGRYTVLRLLGRGGVGAVYEALDPELGRRVAIKVLREDRAGDTEALKREAQALARLVHQNVVTVFDVGEADGEVFVVMQLVEGLTIDDWIEKFRAKPDEIVAKFRQAGEGLMAAHAAGLVHCDFKPSNVLVDQDGVVRVSDFGLARATRSISSLAPGAAIAPIVGMTTIAGTPAYMAPEQFGGAVTAASDQFAYCVALWECLSGERPFEDSSMAVMDADAWRKRRPLKRDTKIPPYVMRALERGMADSAEDRWPNMTALLDALRPRRAPWKTPSIAAGAAVIAVGATFALTRATNDVDLWEGADVAAQRMLTNYGRSACAYSPMFEPTTNRVLFDRTKGDAVDLFSVPIEGGPEMQVTTAQPWEWRPQPGRKPGEIVYLVYDPDEVIPPKILYRDLATGRQSTALDNHLAWDAVVVGDTLYYSPDQPAGIRLQRGNTNSEFLKPEPGQAYYMIAASPDGKRLAVTKANISEALWRPCIVELPATLNPPIACSDGMQMTARPAFGASGEYLYFMSPGGVARREIATGIEQVIVPGVWGEGGVAVAPDGSALAYSTCHTHGAIVDAASNLVLVDDDTALMPAVSREGTLAWIRTVGHDRQVLMVRTRDGRELQMTDESFSSVFHPAFNPAGTHIVFASTTPRPGLHIVDLDMPGSTRAVTNNARDKNPTWLEGDRIAFTRGSAESDDEAWVVARDGSTPEKLHPSARSVWGSRKNEVLVASDRETYWIDVTTKVERPGPPRPPPERFLKAAAVSPSGTWVMFQVGVSGRELYRVRLAPIGELEKVKVYGAGQTVTPATIRDDGSILAAPATFWGELFLVPAKPGATF